MFAPRSVCSDISLVDDDEAPRVRGSLIARVPPSMSKWRGQSLSAAGCDPKSHEPTTRRRRHSHEGLASHEHRSGVARVAPAGYDDGKQASATTVLPDCCFTTAMTRVWMCVDIELSGCRCMYAARQGERKRRKPSGRTKVASTPTACGGVIEPTPHAARVTQGTGSDVDGWPNHALLLTDTAQQHRVEAGNPQVLSRTRATRVCAGHGPHRKEPNRSRSVSIEAEQPTWVCATNWI